jgi:hypothetical protein
MEQSTDEEIRKGLMIRDSFASSQGFVSLHVWLCLTRLRQEGSDSKEVQQVQKSEALQGRTSWAGPVFPIFACSKRGRGTISLSY